MRFIFLPELVAADCRIEKERKCKTNLYNALLTEVTQSAILQKGFGKWMVAQ
jgi:hypothetical protein